MYLCSTLVSDFMFLGSLIVTRVVSAFKLYSEDFFDSNTTFTDTNLGIKKNHIPFKTIKSRSRDESCHN